MTLILGNIDLTPALAEAWVIAATCVILLVDVFLHDRQRWITPLLSLLTLVVAALITAEQHLTGRVLALTVSMSPMRWAMCSSCFRTAP